MAKVKPNTSPSQQKKMRRALTPEARENQMIALAMDLVESRLLDGTATSQETTHFLKLATVKYKQELQKLERENELMKAKTEALQSGEDIKMLYSEAIAAMKRYSGNGDDDDY